MMPPWDIIHAQIAWVSSWKKKCQDNVRWTKTFKEEEKKKNGEMDARNMIINVLRIMDLLRWWMRNWLFSNALVIVNMSRAIFI